jgi:hypothetical protein
MKEVRGEGNATTRVAIEVSEGMSFFFVNS